MKFGNREAPIGRLESSFQVPWIEDTGYENWHAQNLIGPRSEVEIGLGWEISVEVTFGIGVRVDGSINSHGRTEKVLGRRTYR